MESSSSHLANLRDCVVGLWDETCGEKTSEITIYSKFLLLGNSWDNMPAKERKKKTFNLLKEQPKGPANTNTHTSSTRGARTGMNCLPLTASELICSLQAQFLWVPLKTRSSETFTVTAIWYRTPRVVLASFYKIKSWSLLPFTSWNFLIPVAALSPKACALRVAFTAQHEWHSFTSSLLHVRTSKSSSTFIAAVPINNISNNNSSNKNNKRHWNWMGHLRYFKLG